MFSTLFYFNRSNFLVLGHTPSLILLITWAKSLGAQEVFVKPEKQDLMPQNWCVT